MSHEGIRIVGKEQAERESAAEQPLPQDSVTPAKVRVMKSEGTGVAIAWKDGHRSTWNFAWLRYACPCAVCHEEREQTGRPVGVSKPKAGGPFALYEAPPRPNAVAQVGKYALRFEWNDGHQSGIYSWEYLRRVCQCEQCIAARTPAQ